MVDQSKVRDEDIPRFSEAYRDGLLVNEDDDYYMDSLEILRRTQNAFLPDLAAQKDATVGGNEHLYVRVKEAVTQRDHS